MLRSVGHAGAALAALAAAVAMNVVLDVLLIAHFGMGIGGAAAATAQNFGAGKNERVKKCFLTGQAYALALGAVSAIVMYFSAGTTAGFMLGEYSGAAHENAAEYLQTVALFYVLCFTGSAFVGYFDGTGKVALPFAGALGHITLRVILSWLFIGRFGLRAVAAATGIGWLLANVFWSIEYVHYQKRRAG